MPVVAPDGSLLAVLDVDSGAVAAELCRSVVWMKLLPCLRSTKSVVADCRCRHEQSGTTLPPAPAPADLPAAFTATDVAWLEELCGRLGAQPWATGL